MPNEHGEGSVCPIFRRGARVLVKIPFGFCEVIIQWHEFRNGRLWLHGMVSGFMMSFPAKKVRRRLAPHDRLGWPKMR